MNEWLEWLAAIVTWTVVSGAALWVILQSGDRYAGTLVPAAGLALLNLAAMVCACRRSTETRWSYAALWVQLASALALGALLPISFMPIYTIVWIAIAAGFFKTRSIWLLLVGVLLAWFGIMQFLWQDGSAVISVLLYGTFHLFALLTTRNATKAEQARDALAARNRDLLATQHLLTEASREAERARIARDMHDLLGHHLTALSLNLQIAERKSEGAVREQIGESRALARLLLADVREAVSALRQSDGIDFRRAVELLTDGAPGLDISFEMDDGLTIRDFDIAQALLRCVQEAITNTLRHADATHCRIRVWKAADQLHLEVSDNGKGGEGLVEGNGLGGMRERLATVKGSLDLLSRPGGLTLKVALPATDS